MTDPAPGQATYVTRVEAWECDFNGHWNARYYGRGFQAALENIAFRATGGNPGGAGLSRRLIRFHSELLSAELAQVVSWQIVSGPYAGAILHHMTSGGRLAATALDVATFPITGLPQIESLASALPRTIDFDALPVPLAHSIAVDLEPIRAGELNPVGVLCFEDIVRRCGVATHAVLDGLGLNRNLTDRTRVSRMAVEQAVWRMGDAPAGLPTRVVTALHSLRSKSFSLSHRVEGFDGRPIAHVEGCIVTVNLDTRRAVDLPAEFRAALAAQAR
ncbi:MAG: hypothetical protein KDJ98_11980 [Rhodobacteraceae bacterium]|nr:hypothetical protein [Paracoccaceae bacterium]